MKKKFLTLLLALMMALALAVPAWAEQQPGDAFVYDMAGLLSEEDDAYLEALASQISWEHNCAVYIVTMEDYQEYDSDIHYAVVSFYDSNSLGIGENREGILLMLSMYDRSYDLYVRDGGIAQYAVSDYGRHKMTDVFLDNFGEDDWRGGFEDYACEEVTGQLSAARPCHRHCRGAGDLPEPEGHDEVRPQKRPCRYLCDRGGAEPDGAG